MADWFGDHDTLLWWMGGLSVAMFFGTLLAIPILVVRMPADYFMHHKPPPESWRGQHPVIRTALLVIKNLLGLGLVIIGLVLSIPPIPGQGILTILIGLSLLNFPGKRALELRIARQRAVVRAINWMRARGRRPPLELPEPKRRRIRLKRNGVAEPPSGDRATATPGRSTMDGAA